MGAKSSYREYLDGHYRVREISDHIIAHQGICHGQPTFRGTRVLVHLALSSLRESGQSIESVALDYGLPTEAVADALAVAGSLIREQLSMPDPWCPDESSTKAANGTRRRRTARRIQG